LDVIPDKEYICNYLHKSYELLKASLGSYTHKRYLPFVEAPQMHL